MNIEQILSEIEKIDPEINDRLDTRRNAMREFGKIGSKIALAAVPVLFGGLLNKAYGQTSMKPSVVDVLNFALTLEYLESQFYTQGVAAAGLIPTGGIAKQGFTMIMNHELEHVAYLKTAISSLGGTPVTSPKFDFTAGSGSGTGPFADVFTNYNTFMAVSQTLEDTGVRAYKGQATNLMSNNAVLTAALSIHAVEARHASYVRKTRSDFYGMPIDIKPWITGTNTANIGSAVAANYAGEGNTTQLGINIININGFDIPTERASECFDEPLTMNQVLALVTPFIAP